MPLHDRLGPIGRSLPGMNRSAKKEGVMRTPFGTANIGHLVGLGRRPQASESMPPPCLPKSYPEPDPPLGDDAKLLGEQEAAAKLAETDPEDPAADPDDEEDGKEDAEMMQAR